MVNKVIILGNVGKDVTSYDTTNNGGNPRCNFPVATTERYNRSGEIVEKTEWHRVVAFGKLASFATNYVTSGKQVYVEGKLHTHNYTDKDGVAKTSVEIIADEIKLCGKKGE